MSIKDRCVFLSELKTEVFHFQRLLQPFPPHFHDAHVIGCLLAGKREITCDRTNRILSEGSCEVIPSGFAHACKPLCGQSEWICLHIRDELPFPSIPACFSDSSLFRLFRELSKSFSDRAAMLKISKEIIGFCIRLGESDSGVSAEEQFAFLRRRIAENFENKMSVANMAAEANLGKYDFLRSFHACAGITPYRYLEAVRISNCQRLIRAGESLASCAQSTGFCDQAHLSRCFKSRVGITPGEYRRVFSSMLP